MRLAQTKDKNLVTDGAYIGCERIKKIFFETQAGVVVKKITVVQADCLCTKLLREEMMTSEFGQRFYGEFERVVIFCKLVKHGAIEFKTKRKAELFLFFGFAVLYVLNQFAVFIEMMKVEEAEVSTEEKPKFLNKTHFLVL